MLWRRMMMAGVVAWVVVGWAVTPATGRGEVGGGTPFSEQAMARGLVYPVRPISPFEQSTLGQGIAIVDLNGSGHQDVVVMGHPDQHVGFFENTGGGLFVDRSWKVVGGEVLPKLAVAMGSGIAAADYNGDGLVDVFVTQLDHKSDVLLRNDGGFALTDVTQAAGVGNIGNGHAALWGDYDNDGWLDLYVVNYTLPSLAGDPTYRNKLYRNRGDGTFEDVSVGSGVDDPGVGLAAVFADLNRDGWLDLYLANDKGHLPPTYHGNRSWRNVGGTFEDTCAISQTCLGFWAMGVAAGDVTGDGYADLYVTNLPHPSGYHGWNPLFVNQGDDRFSEQCTAAGVCQFVFSWAAIFFDFNNNGWLDLYVCNQAQDNRLYANTGSFPLSDVAGAFHAGGSAGHSYNAAVGDLTGNGSLDIVMNDYGSNNQPRNVQLLINREGESRSWVRFHVIGVGGNRQAIGSNVQVTAAGHTQWRELYAGGNNYKSQNELVYHFGLNNAPIVDEITVNWPGGKVSRTLSGYPVNATWRIYPPQQLGDADQDGTIGVDDLLVMLGAFGPVQSGVEMLDITGDGVIDVDDLLQLLLLWE